jgi:DNA-binding NtrC family response regulator
VSDRPSLATIALSESFHRTWSDLAHELGLDLVRLTESAAPPAGILAIIIAAGGEEDRALDLVPTVRHAAEVPLYVVGANASHRFAVEALRRGANDYFALPDDLDLLRRTLAARTDAVRSSAPARARPDTDAFGTLQGESAQLLEVVDAARRVAKHGDVTVLIHGETGTGKELLAEALHASGPRQHGPFVAVNCAAIPAALMESELFGHERGAFTDAHAAKPGLFEEAHRGTLFLDEIGHLSLPLQGKLLRALDDHRIRRVGATQSREIDVRIMAATHVDLAQAVERGEFREDLYYRLNVVVLTLPPLRERGNDVVVLTEHFLQRLARRYGLPRPTIDDATRLALQRYDWPGNVRELLHAVERSLLLSESGALEAQYLTSTPSGGPRRANGAIPFPATLDEIQAAAARAALLQHDGNKTAAARQLGISRARLQRFLDRGEG